MKSTTMVAMLTALVLPMVASAHERPRVPERDGLRCPAGAARNSPEQVMQERLAAIAAGDMELFFCSYAVDATVVMPGSVVKGRRAVMDQFNALFGLLGGQIPQVTSLTFADGVALLTWFISTPFVSVADGADTFIIKNGKIQYQTVHATLSFGAP